MVREIIHLQVGQCGNQVGLQLWHALYAEHGLIEKSSKFDPKNPLNIDADGDGIPDQLEKIGVYFHEKGKEDSKTEKENYTYVPRAILVDLEPGTLDVIKSDSLGGNFKEDNQITGANGAGNNWAKGHYTEGAELIETVLDQARKEIENADSPQGFQVFHSLGGGTGSGMGTLLLLKLRDQYPDRITVTYSVFPSPKVSDTVVEPYNAVLSSHQLLENADETFIIDNEALYHIFTNVLKQSSPTYSELNKLVAKVGCGITCSLRFPGKLNGDLRKLGVNLVPFPRLHFFLVSHAPLTAAANSSHVNYNAKTLTAEIREGKTFFAKVEQDEGKYLACALTYRGGDANISTSQVDAEVRKFNDDEKDRFVEWIPHNVKSGLVEIPPVESKISCTFVGNSTGLKSIFQRLATQFGALYRRKAFLHWYKNEGMDEMEFQEADKNVRDLITEYQDKQDAVVEDEEEGSEAEQDEDI